MGSLNKMNVVVIGRGDTLLNATIKLVDAGYNIVGIITAKAAQEYKVQSKDFEEIATKIGAKFLYSAKLNEHTEYIKSFCGDVAVSANFPNIIEQNIIELFPLGILNSHGGDLPRYRGNACQAWAILNREKRIGLCVHKMVGGEVDSGDILARDYFTLDQSTKIGDVLNWIHSTAPMLFLTAITKLNQNPGYLLEKQSVRAEDALRCYPLMPEDGKLDWTKSAEEILARINAFNKPYDGAFCYLGAKKFKIWDAELVEEYENFKAVGGQITKVTDDCVEVACGEGKLSLRVCEVSGKTGAPSFWIKSIRTRLTSMFECYDHNL
jgi:methionyl-tRNA formyltransferase